MKRKHIKAGGCAGNHLLTSMIAMAAVALVTTTMAQVRPRQQGQPGQPAQPGQPGQRPSPETLYRQFDANRDGKLSAQEFNGVLRFSPRLRDNPDQAEAAFQQFDGDSDGTLSVDVFRRFLDLSARMQTRPGASPAAQAQQRLDSGFQFLDTNKDSKLDQKEFQNIGQFVARLQNDTVSVLYLFNELDKNQDGGVTLVEYRGLAALSQPNPPPANTTAKATTPERAPTASEVDFFEKKIRPVLAKSCYSCHSSEADKVKGSLLVDTREGIRRGGDNGSAVIPGDVDGSLLIKAIRYHDGDLQMPPKKDGGKLPDAVIADFEQWVRMGAPDPRDGKVVTKSMDIEKGRQHWSFQLPKKAPAPAVKDSAWPRNDIDRHVLSGIEANGLKPVGDADKRTLIRRLYYDLIGLPPTPEDVDAFVRDSDPKAVEKVVDKLLASPQYGERWGRHWLDVARYAESSGKENNILYPHAWRYRDYVIGAFNDDKPYNHFLKEQIAGDLLPAKNDTQRAEQLIATGFLAIGPKSHNTRDPRQFALDVADEQIDAISQGMMGLTVACARCHDHKFDPIPQKDYYAMAGIFLSTETRFGTPRFIQNNQVSPLLSLPEKANIVDAPPPSAQEIEAMERQLEQFKSQRDRILAESSAKGDRGAFANPQIIGANIQISVLEKQLGRIEENGKMTRLAMGVQERNFQRDAQVLQRGEMDKPGDTVPRGFVQVVSTKPQPRIGRESGRRELAEWIAAPENPLTARVMVNRVWLHLFGRGIVPTPDNFGTTGQAPTNPALLDHLAVSFIENGWSVKQLIRDIVLSHAYQLSSDYSAQNYASDPDNIHLWRMSKRRLDAEAIRDGMLAVSGWLETAPIKGSAVANAEGPVLRLNRSGALTQDRFYRSIYLPIVRDQVPDSLDVFDFAEPSLVVGDRDDTNVPGQALFLLNSITVMRLADAMADRLMDKSLTAAERGKRAFELVFSRPPSATEMKATEKFFAEFFAAEGAVESGKDKVMRKALVAFCQALLGSAEFRFLN